MFTMMNAARLGVGIQGLGLAEVSYQNAVAYARDRLQGRSADRAPRRRTSRPIRSSCTPTCAESDDHAGLHRGLRARWPAGWGWTSTHASRHPDPAERQAADDLVALMTPVVKAFFTDIGFEVTNLGVQVFGGHGYIREYGMEQFVRDARIAQIYEGTNGVQALDLVGRKLPQDMGRLLRRFFHPVSAFLEEAQADAGCWNSSSDRWPRPSASSSRRPR